MEGYELKKLSDVEQSASAEDANVLIEQDGEIKKVPKDKVGGVPSWNDLTDKPFDEKKILIEWDGVIGDRFSLNMPGNSEESYAYVKVSDEPMPLEFLTGGSFTVAGYTLEIREGDVESIVDGLVGHKSGYVLIAYESGEYNLGTNVFLESGVYFQHVSFGEEVIYVSRLENSIVNTIDPKFIPDISGGKTNHDVIIKTWNFGDKVECSHSFEEAKMAVENGKNVVWKIQNWASETFLNVRHAVVSYPGDEALTCYFMEFRVNGVHYDVLTFAKDGTITYNEYSPQQ